ncbi:MAG: hypothetical protein IBX63_04995 [Coriobacteriia bacterium]|nr:hypothetical protein [Coriobacteriia bacterium]
MRRLLLRGWTDRTPAEKRHFAARVGLVVLALVVLVVIPAYLASKPSFMQRYAAFEPAYETWTESLHDRVSCQQCHVPPDLPARALYTTRMFGEFYLSLVLPAREPALLGTPTNEACSRCHMELRTVSPSGDLNIPHRAHVEMLGMDCVECHGYLIHEVSAEGSHTPPMAGCLTCHDGETAKRECSACHTDKDQPDTHLEPDWVFAHPAAEDESCNRCHGWTEHWCVDCHAVRPASHGEDWRAQHRFRVENHRNCEACHVGSFCVRCHGRVPSLNYDSTITLVDR